MMRFSYVEEASRWTDDLARYESRRPGDYDNALRRVSRRIGVGYETLRSLRYKPGKRIWTDVYFTLSAAHETMLAAQLLALEAQIDERKASGSPSRAVRAAEALVGEVRGGKGS